MNLTDVKSQVASRIAEKRNAAGAMTRAGSFGQDSRSLISYAPIVIGGGVLTVSLLALLRPNATPTPDTGNAQIDQAMQMLQQQQDINRELLQGQQELNAQMIQAQSKAQTVQPSINCFLAVCPGTGRQESGTDDYAIVGPGIQTARIDPARVMPQLIQAAPPPVQTAPPPAPTVPVHYDPWQEHYRLMSANAPEVFQGQLNECINSGWQLPVDDRINCVAINQYLRGAQ